MSKVAYRKPLAELVEFEDSDIICASAIGKDEWDQDKIDEKFGCHGTTSHVVKDF